MSTFVGGLDSREDNVFFRTHSVTYEDGICILRIARAASVDGGEYTCEAQNAIGDASTTCLVNGEWVL